MNRGTHNHITATVILVSFTLSSPSVSALLKKTKQIITPLSLDNNKVKYNIANVFTMTNWK